jgi:hypothetical protein
MHTTRPKLPVEVRPGSDCNGLVTGRSLANLGERQLFDLMAGSNQHGAVLKRSLMEGAKILRRVPCGIVCSRREAVLKRFLMNGVWVPFSVPAS